ncbi:glycosyltransferase family 2 protein [Pontibacter sp. G13]|uniref:glycosyltransferase family 2 protein n=1 Tax=Pontibacter sp. G13 TaxID=3074898 RepID=UPI00288A615F|nr:glycosyltransferase family 2 protein [Pontibacter sp. G13]WNJ16283.1 glycosyltransferase family 2 protein [Pontibacter sp. G13]
MRISIVIPLHNESPNISPLLEAIRNAGIGDDYEVVLVDDGSTDDTVAQVKLHADDHTKLVVLAKNFGQTTAMMAGIDAAEGDYIVTMDGDLQNDPSDIPIMLDKLETEQWDVVAGIRQNRQDGFLLRKLPSKWANWLIRKLTGVHMKDYGCTLKVFKKNIAKNLGLYGDLHRFIPVLVQMQGGRMVEMEVKHHARQFGQSKYGLGRTTKVLSDLLLMVFFQKYLQRPMHIFGLIGLLSFAVGGMINIYLLILKLMGQDIWGRPILILGVTLVLAGIQFLIFGVLAEVLVRIYFESQGKKTYYVREIFHQGSSTAPHSQAVS